MKLLHSYITLSRGYVGENQRGAPKHFCLLYMAQAFIIKYMALGYILGYILG